MVRDAKMKPTAALVMVGVVGIVAVALWLSVAAIFENMRFVQASEQILTLMARSRDYVRERGGYNEGPDLLAQLGRGARVVGVQQGPVAFVSNAWGRRMTLGALEPLRGRLETTVPTSMCRRLVEFFGGDLVGLGILRIEARNESIEAWRLIYEGGGEAHPAKIVAGALMKGCGVGDWAQMGLTFELK